MDNLEELVEQLRFRNLIDAVKSVSFKPEETELIAEVIRRKALQNAAIILENDKTLKEEVNKTR